MACEKPAIERNHPESRPGTYGFLHRRGAIHSPEWISEWRAEVENALDDPNRKIAEYPPPKRLSVHLRISLVGLALFDDGLRPKAIQKLKIKGYYDERHTVMASMDIGTDQERFFFDDRVYPSRAQLLEAVAKTKYSLVIHYLPSLGVQDPGQDLALILEMHRSVVKYDGVNVYRVEILEPRVPQ